MPIEARVPPPRSSFRWRLLLAFFGVSSFAIVGGAVAFYALSNIENVLVRITDQSVPSVLVSLQLSRDAERLVSAAPVLLASSNQDEHQRQATSIRNDIARLKGVLDSLKQYRIDASVIEQIAEAVDWLTLNLISMETTVGNALTIGEQRKALTREALELASAIRLELGQSPEKSNVLEGTPSAATDTRNTSTRDIDSLRVVLRLRFEVAALADQLSSIGLIDDPGKLKATRQKLADSSESMRTLIQQLGTTRRSAIGDRAARFFTYVDGSKSIARIRSLELEARQNAQRLLSESTKASRKLTETIDSLVENTGEEINRAGAAARQERRTGTVLQVAAVVLSLLSSVLIVWLYVQRNLISRLTALSRSMLSIAGGDLDARIPSGGTDEISSMSDALTVFRAATAERMAAERARANLSRYFSPNLAEHLAQNPGTLEVGGERRELTFLFTDLASFTTLVERLDPAVIVSVMNDYIGGISAIVFEHGGTVDTVVGDAVHAIFGAPLEQPDHAEKGVACALAIDVFSRGFAEDRAGENIPMGMTRIGVHTGSAIVGNFGGENYFHYTAHGDAVNTAARLETANKAFGTRMCVSADTVKAIPGFVGRPIGNLTLKGKANEIFAFEPLDRSQAGSERLNEYLQAFEMLRDGDPDCLRAFASYVGKYEGDTLANFHLQRLLAGQISTRISLTEI
ncbi:MAG: adenylate/guanylate cyclase domain-containing protein [Gammaproteobacteria bacterium]|jgi:class 3 adenylate cyclase